MHCTLHPPSPAIAATALTRPMSSPPLLAEFLTLASVHFVAMAAPGPDFTLVVSQSVRNGRAAGIWVALGIAAGLALHVLYTVLGVGALMHTTPWLLNVARGLGAAYIMFIAWQMLRARPADGTGSLAAPAVPRSESAESPREAERGVERRPPPTVPHSSLKLFSMGFLTNATNPKVTLFFLAIFTSVVSARTPMWAQIGYGLWMIMVNAIWFSLVASFFSTQRVRALFMRLGHWFERLMGALLMLFALRLLWEILG